MLASEHDDRAFADLVRTHPIAPEANIRADEIERTAGGTLHLVQVRGGESPHRHVAHDLVVQVVAGHGALTLGGVRRELRAGDVAVVPRGVPHWFVNTGGDPAIALVVFMPPLDAPDSIPVDAVDSRAGAR
jgi:quercetin dioxygenase-like cupin family protein